MNDKNKTAGEVSDAIRMAEMRERSVSRYAVGCLDSAIGTLQRAIRELEYRKNEIADECTSVNHKVNLLHGAINHLACNVLGNCHLDSMARASGEFMELIGREEAAS